MPVSLTGISGTVNISGTGSDVPIWLLLVFSVAATVIGILNSSGVTSIPKPTPLLILLIAGGFYAALIFFAGRAPDTGATLHVSIGPILALAATVGGVVLILFPGRDRSDADNTAGTTAEKIAGCDVT
jgi:hypothetical protein